MATEHQLEVLNDAHQALLYAGDFMSGGDPRTWIRKSNRLLDACVDAGMPIDHPGEHTEWAAIRITEWLCSGPLELAA